MKRESEELQTMVQEMEVTNRDNDSVLRRKFGGTHTDPFERFGERRREIHKQYLREQEMVFKNSALQDYE